MLLMCVVDIPQLQYSVVLMILLMEIVGIRRDYCGSDGVLYSIPNPVFCVTIIINPLFGMTYQ